MAVVWGVRTAGGDGGFRPILRSGSDTARLRILPSLAGFLFGKWQGRTPIPPIPEAADLGLSFPFPAPSPACRARLSTGRGLSPGELSYHHVVGEFF